MAPTELPERLAAVVAAFRAAPASLALDLLLEHARSLPPLPPALSEHPERLERVDECQTPFFLASEIDAEGRVHLHFDAPPEAPTTRGFAGVLYAGLEGATVDEVLAVPLDVADALGLQRAISPLRLRGMSAILGRLQRQVRAAAGRA